MAAKRPGWLLPSWIVLSIPQRAGQPAGDSLPVYVPVASVVAVSAAEDGAAVALAHGAGTLLCSETPEEVIRRITDATR